MFFRTKSHRNRAILLLGLAALLSLSFLGSFIPTHASAEVYETQLDQKTGASSFTFTFPGTSTAGDVVYFVYSGMGAFQYPNPSSITVNSGSISFQYTGGATQSWINGSGYYITEGWNYGTVSADGPAISFTVNLAAGCIRCTGYAFELQGVTTTNHDGYVTTCPSNCGLGFGAGLAVAANSISVSFAYADGNNANQYVTYSGYPTASYNTANPANAAAMTVEPSNGVDNNKFFVPNTPPTTWGLVAINFPNNQATQPIKATFNSVNGGTPQTVTISGGAPSPVIFAGDGNVYDITINQNTVFSMSLPTGYQFIGGSGTTTCSAGNTCSEYDTSYEYAAVGQVVQPIDVIFSNQNGGTPQTVTVSGGSPSPTTIAGDSLTHNVLINPTTSFTLSLPSGYQFLSGTGTTTCGSGTCSQYTTSYDAVGPTTVAQPIQATFSSGNGGSPQTVTVNGCSPSPSSISGDGTAHSVTMLASCNFGLSLPSGYVFLGGSGTTSCSSGTCSTYSTSYQFGAPSSVQMIQMRVNYATSTASFSLAYTNNVVSGDLMVIDLHEGSCANPTSPSDSQGNSFIEGIGPISTPNIGYSTIWYGFEKASGPDTVTATCSNGGFIMLGLAEMSGLVAFSTSAYGQCDGSCSTITLTNPFTAVSGGAFVGFIITGGSSPTVSPSNGMSVIATAGGCYNHPATGSEPCIAYSTTLSGSGQTAPLTLSAAPSTWAELMLDFSSSVSPPPSTVTQPIAAGFNSVNGGTQQSLSILGCSPSPSSLFGDGTVKPITMTPSCTFSLSLPSGYQFLTSSSGTTCSSGTCSEFDAIYEASVTPTVNQPIRATFNSGNGGTQQTVTVSSNCNPSPSTLTGDGNPHTISMSASCEFSLSLPSGYQFTTNPTTRSCSSGGSGTCSEFDVGYQASAASTVTQPLKATFNSANGGAIQTMTIAGCGANPSTFAGDGNAYNIAMSPSCPFTVSVPTGYQVTSANTAFSCPSGTCTEVDITYQQNAAPSGGSDNLLCDPNHSQTIVFPIQNITLPSSACGGYAGDWQLYSNRVFFNGISFGAFSNPVRSFGLDATAASTVTVTVTGVSSTGVTVSMTCVSSATCYVFYYYGSNPQPVASITQSSGTTVIPPSQMYTSSGAFASASPPAAYLNAGSGYVEVKITYSGTNSISFTDSAPSGSITQPIQVTVPNGAPSGVATLSGCGVSPTTLTMDGSPHPVTASPSCQITLSMPSDQTNTHYRLTGGGTSSIITTCSTGTCSTTALTAYYQTHNTYDMSPGTPSTWDASYTEPVQGTSLGIVSTLCTVSLVSGGSTVGCVAYSDYNTLASEVASFPSSVSGVWSATGTYSWMDTTGGNTHTATYDTATSVTQPVTCTLAESGAPTPSQITVSVSGGTVTPNNIACSTGGTTTDLTVSAGATVTLTVPNDGVSSRYRWTSGTTTSFIACNTGTCSTSSQTLYNNVLNTYNMSPTSPSKWDSAYSEPVTGTVNSVGGTVLCHVALANGGGTSGCQGWSDYGFTVTTMASFIGSTGIWTGSNTQFTPVSGGNIYASTYSLTSASVIQPLKVSFNNQYGGSVQTVTISGCSSLPSTFTGSGTVTSITMSPNCTFSLSLPSGYSFISSSTGTSCASGTCAVISISYSIIPATITEEVTITPYNNAPAGASIVISGCDSTSNSIPMDGAQHTFTANTGCQLKFTTPAPSLNSRYLFSTGNNWQYTTGLVSGFDVESNVVYYQLQNAYTATPNQPWDAGLTINLVGTYFGMSGTSLGNIYPKGSTTNIASITLWADWNTQVTYPNSPVGATGINWVAQPPVAFVDSTGGNSHNVGYNHMVIPPTANIVQTNACNVSSGTTITCAFSNTVDVNDGIVVTFSSSASLSSIITSDSIQSVYKEGPVLTTSGTTTIFYADIPSSGPDTITVSMSSSSAAIIDIYEVSGITTLNPTFVTGSGSGSGTHTTSSSAGLATNSLLIASIGPIYGTATAGSGYTLGVVNSVGGSEYATSGVISPTNFPYGDSMSGSWQLEGVVFNPIGNMIFSWTLTGGGAFNVPTLTCPVGGTIANFNLTATPTPYSCDAGSTWTVSPTLGGASATSRERASPSEVTNGTTASMNVIFTYYNQYFVYVSFQVPSGTQYATAPTLTYNEYSSSTVISMSTVPTGYWMDATSQYAAQNPFVSSVYTFHPNIPTGSIDGSAIVESYALNPTCGGNNTQQLLSHDCLVPAFVYVYANDIGITWFFAILIGIPLMGIYMKTENGLLVMMLLLAITLGVGYLLPTPLTSTLIPVAVAIVLTGIVVNIWRSR